MVFCLGNAGTQSAGLWEFHHEQAMSKQLLAGKAAMGGVMSAMLAKQGFPGLVHLRGRAWFSKSFFR